MPILPLDHPEPFAASLGVMLYPGTDEADRRNAAAFAAQYLAKPMRRFREAGGTAPYDDLVQITAASGERLKDLDKRWWGGIATGELLKVLFALFNTNEPLASWSSAIKIAETVAAQRGDAGSRSSLWQARSQFGAVAHLWAAYCIRERRFSAEPNVGYDGWADFQCFLAEAEILRVWGQSWRPSRDKSAPLLPADVWRPPDGWAPPTREPGWPDTGMIPALTLSAELLRGLKPAGRPRKIA